MSITNARQANSTIYNVADYFIYLAKEVEEAGLTNLKIQKLCYYAQGFYLAEHDGTPLFENDIQAWDHGPVIQELYGQVAKYGRNFISDYINPEFSPDDLDQETQTFLNDIFQDFGQYSAWALREMTHKETPWKDSYKKGVTHIVIPQDTIEAFFKEQISNG